MKLFFFVSSRKSQSFLPIFWIEKIFQVTEQRAMLAVLVVLIDDFCCHAKVRVEKRFLIGQIF